MTEEIAIYSDDKCQEPASYIYCLPKGEVQGVCVYHAPKVRVWLRKHYPHVE